MKLEPKVTEVLAYLATRPGEVVSRDDIEQAVWPNALVGYESVTKSIIKLQINKSRGPNQGVRVLESTMSASGSKQTFKN